MGAPATDRGDQPEADHVVTSFHPGSKWWCSGAMRKTLPVALKDASGDDVGKNDGDEQAADDDGERCTSG